MGCMFHVRHSAADRDKLEVQMRVGVQWSSTDRNQSPHKYPVALVDIVYLPHKLSPDQFSQLSQLKW